MREVVGADEGAREGIVVVDEPMARRALRAARRHVLRRPQTWAILLGAVTLLWLPTVTAELTGPGLRPQVLASSAGILLCATALCPVVGLAMVRLSTSAAVARNLAPGQLVGVVVGPHSLRVRGHHCSHEVSYDLLHTVDQYDGIVVVAMTGRYWLLPAEAFDTAGLVALRQRAGRRPFPLALLVG